MGRSAAPEPALAADTALKLKSYQWPGNVRELRNVLERAVILSGGSPIAPAHIMIEGAGYDRSSVEDHLHSLLRELNLPAIEKRLVEIALEISGGNKSRAAEKLGISRRALYGRLEKFGLFSEDAGESEG
jgi:DNA-binding NtrC family response regulator